MQELFDSLSFAGQEWALLIVSMIPLIELRGAIILGAAMNMPWLEVFIISVLGNLLPVPFIIKFGEALIEWLKSTPLFSRIARKYELKLRRKSKKIMKYSAIGLCLFVAIPFPGTGAWSGAAIAALLNMRMKYAFTAIATGILIAGTLMTIGSYGTIHVMGLF